MLTENEETIAVNMMLLHDCIKQHNKPEVVIEEMVEAEKELTGFINDMWDSLTEREKKPSTRPIQKRKENGLKAEVYSPRNRIGLINYPSKLSSLNPIKYNLSLARVTAVYNQRT